MARHDRGRGADPAATRFDRSRSRLRSADSHSDLTRIVAAATISTFGSMLSGVALPLLAVDQLGAGPFDMAVMRVARLAPNLVLGLLIAAWLDRQRRRPIMIAIDVAQEVLL